MRARLIDVVLGAIAFCFGLASLAYPYGRDQGLYYYVAREWVLHGAVPYKDVLDHKTPGIYLLYGLGVRLFGEQTWGIRLFDVLCVAAIGFIAAELSSARGEKVRPGVRGAAWLAASVLYFGYLDFWDTAQSELWYSMFGLAAVACVDRIASERRAAVAAGFLSGAAMLMKPPAIWLVLLAVALLVARTYAPKQERRSARLKPAGIALISFAVGAAVLPALVVAYFGAKGAIPAMVDILVGANSYYVKHETGGGFDAIVGYHWCYFPLVPAILLYLVGALGWARWKNKKASLRRHTIAAGALVATYAAVIMQGKFYLLHWTVAVPAFVLIVANAFRSLAETLEERGHVALLPLTYGVLLFGLWACALFSWRGPHMWLYAAQHTYLHKRGLEPRDVYLQQFHRHQIDFDYGTSEKVGDWLREHTTPQDLVCVRGFEPQIYAVAQRHHGGRFFWTTFITNPARAYKREQWLKEDRDALIASRPKYVVTLHAIKEGPDSASYVEPLGYRVVAELGQLDVLERVAVDATAPGIP